MANVMLAESEGGGVSVTGLPALRDNYIWVLQDNAAGNAVVVDPGDARPVLDHLARDDLRLTTILLTHWHADHVGGVPGLLQKHPQTVVCGPAAESITGLTQPLHGGEVLQLPIGEVSVASFPGHTRGHLAYALPGRLFSGDILFGLGCGRLFEGTPEQMARALAVISALPDATRIYCAHEYTALNLGFALAVDPHNAALLARAERIEELAGAGQPTVPLLLGEEKATNPFLRCESEAVRAAVWKHGGAGCDRDGANAGAGALDPVTVFAILRAWRNEF